MSQSTKAPTAPGNDSLMREPMILPKSPYGFGTGSATIVGRPAISGRHCSRGTYPLASASAAIAERKGAVDEALYRGGRPKAGGEVEQFSVDAKEAFLDVLIQGHVRATEAIDGLLRVSDEE